MADKEKIVTILARGGTTAAWESVNPTPKNREFCVEETADGRRKFKIGDGSTPWNDLPYATTDELADLTQDSTHRTVTDTEKATWNAKQNALTFDTTPTAGSTNPVTSGGVKTALDAKANDADLAAIAKSGQLSDATQDSTHRTVTDTEKATWNAAAAKEIPTKTSDLTNDGENGTDKFATESYVNQKTSQIYRYKGSVATYSDLPTTHDVGDVYNVVAAYGNYPAGTNFAWNGTEWDALGGSVDLSAYVEESELAAIAKSGKLSDATQDSTHRTVTDTEKATWNAKQNALTFDTTPTAGSTNPVTSGGVKTALDAKANSSDIIKTSTGLSDSDDLMRYTDTITINGGGV